MNNELNASSIPEEFITKNLTVIVDGKSTDVGESRGSSSDDSSSSGGEDSGPPPKEKLKATKSMTNSIKQLETATANTAASLSFIDEDFGKFHSMTKDLITSGASTIKSIGALTGGVRKGLGSVKSTMTNSFMGMRDKVEVGQSEPLKNSRKDLKEEKTRSTEELNIIRAWYKETKIANKVKVSDNKDARKEKSLKAKEDKKRFKASKLIEKKRTREATRLYSLQRRKWMWEKVQSARSALMSFLSSPMGIASMIATALAPLFGKVIDKVIDLNPFSKKTDPRELYNATQKKYADKYIRDGRYSGRAQVAAGLDLDDNKSISGDEASMVKQAVRRLKNKGITPENTDSKTFRKRLIEETQAYGKRLRVQKAQKGNENLTVPELNVKLIKKDKLLREAGNQSNPSAPGQNPPITIDHSTTTINHNAESVETVV